MESVVNVVHNISDSLAEDMKPGNNDEVMAIDEVTLLVSTVPIEHIQNGTEKITKQGSMKIGDPKQLLGDDTPACLESQVITDLSLFEMY